MEKIDIANRIANLLIEVHNEKYKAIKEKNDKKYSDFAYIEDNLKEDLKAMNFEIDLEFKCIGFQLYEKD